MTIEDATSTITAAYEARQIAIEADSELQYLLTEVEKFKTSTKGLLPGTTEAETDDSAVQTGAILLRSVRLADSIALLAHHGVPKITETLKTLASFKHADAEHEAQFGESEYELHMASQFVGLGHRVAFVDTRRPSRYQQRVEFILGSKWPVECKRPRSKKRIVENIDKAIAKIDERTQPGIVCIGLEEALPMDEKFLQGMGQTDLVRSVSVHLNQWLVDNRELIQQKLAKGYARFLIVTYMALSYTHGDEHVALPSLRLGLSSKGEWITSDVARHCIAELQNERVHATDQDPT